MENEARRSQEHEDTKNAEHESTWGRRAQYHVAHEVYETQQYVGHGVREVREHVKTNESKWNLFDINSCNTSAKNNKIFY